MSKWMKNRMWRWHFFAALCITPLLITLSLSAGGYLFKNEAEGVLYKDLFFGKSTQTASLTLDEAIQNAEQQFRGYKVSKVIYPERGYNPSLALRGELGDTQYVYLDANHQMVGSLRSEGMFSDLMRNLHSSLLVGGTVVNYMVELASCWAVFMIVTGLWMTFSKNGVTLRRVSNARQRIKNTHAILGTIIAVPMVLIIVTGLPWSAFMGDKLNSLAMSNTSLGFPQLMLEPPSSNRNEVPWATRDLKTPASTGQVAAAPALGVSQVVTKVQQAGISEPYSLILPSSPEDVFTVAKSGASGITGLDVAPQDELTAYFDQYSGKLLGQVGYADYGWLAKFFAWGIPLHEGHLFGWPNQLLNLLVLLLFLGSILWGFRAWLARKVKGALSAPPAAPLGPAAWPFLLLLAVLGVAMPLFGLSVLALLVMELVLHVVKRWRAV